MVRNLLVASGITFLFLNFACYDASERVQPASLKAIGNLKLYTFSSDEKYFLKGAQPHVLPADTSLKDALISLGKHLSKTYFSKTYSDTATEIHFEVLRIEEISINDNLLKVAIINMVDTQEDAMKYFFQGSTGGQTTFFILGATLMQPHLEQPLVDGLMLLYNGESLPELDHINLSGILTPRLVKYVAMRAIQGTQMKSADSQTLFLVKK